MYEHVCIKCEKKPRQERTTQRHISHVRVGPLPSAILDPICAAPRGAASRRTSISSYMAHALGKPHLVQHKNRKTPIGQGPVRADLGHQV